MSPTNLRSPEAAQPVMSDWPDEQTDDLLYTDDCNFYKVEAWSRDGNRIDAPAVGQQQSA
jgi:hypothetical protein